MAINAVLPVAHVQVWSRSPEHRERFTRRASEELGVTAAPARSAEHAVRGADIVVLATTSPVPVIDPAWVTDGTHITSLGPKQHGRSEFGPDLAERADVIATDSLGQARAYKPPFCLAGTRTHGPDGQRRRGDPARLAGPDSRRTGHTVLLGWQAGTQTGSDQTTRGKYSAAICARRTAMAPCELSPSVTAADPA